MLFLLFVYFFVFSSPPPSPRCSYLTSRHDKTYKFLFVCLLFLPSAQTKPSDSPSRQILKKKKNNKKHHAPNLLIQTGKTTLTLLSTCIWFPTYIPTSYIHRHDKTYFVCVQSFQPPYHFIVLPRAFHSIFFIS